MFSCCCCCFKEKKYYSFTSDLFRINLNMLVVCMNKEESDLSRCRFAFLLLRFFSLFFFHQSLLVEKVFLTGHRAVMEKYKVTQRWRWCPFSSITKNKTTKRRAQKKKKKKKKKKEDENHKSIWRSAHHKWHITFFFVLPCPQIFGSIRISVVFLPFFFSLFIFRDVKRERERKKKKKDNDLPFCLFHGKKRAHEKWRENLLRLPHSYIFIAVGSVAEKETDK